MVGKPIHCLLFSLIQQALVVCTQSLLEQAAARPGSGILDFEEKPLLVIEVVSQNRRADYVIKRADYELANVPEYVIVDPTPNKELVRIVAFTEGEDIYTQTDFRAGQQMVSVVFPNLTLSVNEILSPPLVEGLIKAEQARFQELEQRAERLAVRLRELGVDPDRI
ncbi:Uma2 family endonuclease [Microcoleus vaginatus]|uniref:Uma2 family endonuclease n=1 Tax=Microcoleus vaginatus TaxID=119532 RepID=UPI0032A582B5